MSGANRLAVAQAAILIVVVSPVRAAEKVSVPEVRMPRAYESLMGSAAPAALDRWWLLFNDPALNALEDEAMRNGPDALTAAARILEARETRRAQTAQTLPSGPISGNASRQKTYDLTGNQNLTPTGGVTDTLSVNFNVSWELDLFGRLAVARRVAASDAAQARFNIEGTRASLAAAVADSYFQAVGLAIQLEDARQTERIESDLQDVARRKADAGAGPEDEIDRVAGQRSQAKAQADDLDAQLHTVRRQILILVGRGLAPDGELAIGAAPDDLPPTPSSLPAELLTRRPDIRESEFRLRSQIGTARLRHLAVFPTITLLPGLGLSRVTSPGVSFIPPNTLIPSEVTTSQGFWSLAAGLNVPTLDIPKLLYQARAEDARTREAAIAYEQTVQNAYGEAQNAITLLSASERASAELTDGEARARKAYDGARRRYDAGLDDLTSTLNAEQTWRAIRSAETGERVMTLRHAVQTYKALGGGWVYSNQTGGI